MNLGSEPFDDAIVVDWSAAATPKIGADSCWVAFGALSGRRAPIVENPRTRHRTMEIISEALRASLTKGRRTLVAIDVSFGFATGAAHILGLDGEPPWRAVWSGLERLITDDERNANNRFEVADQLNQACGTRVFWGRPIAPAFDHLVHLPIKNVDVEGLAPNPLPRLRTCETLAGPGVISNWMLVGKGSVGGQILTCLPHLERLRHRFSDKVAVWPFESPSGSIRDPGTPIVLAETWFGLFSWQDATGRVRDESQVRGTLGALRQLGPSGVASLFAPGSLESLSTRRRQEILAEEGWTLGIP